MIVRIRDTMDNYNMIDHSLVSHQVSRFFIVGFESILDSLSKPYFDGILHRLRRKFLPCKMFHAKCYHAKCCTFLEHNILHGGDYVEIFAMQNAMSPCMQIVVMQSIAAMLQLLTCDILYSLSLMQFSLEGARSRLRLSRSRRSSVNAFLFSLLFLSVILL